MTSLLFLKIEIFKVVDKVGLKMISLSCKRVGGFLLLISILTCSVQSTNEPLSSGSSSKNIVVEESSDHDVIEGQVIVNLPKNVGDSGVIKTENNGVDEETLPTSMPTYATTNVTSTTVSGDDGVQNLYDLSVPKLIMLTLLTLAIPLIFMPLMMWRMHKEKKYLDPNNGALVYRETIIVPSYTIANAQPSPNYNVTQLHNALCDAPPGYDTVIKKANPEKSELAQSSPVNDQASSNTEEPPPPSYETVYM